MATFPEKKVYTVTEITRSIKLLLETSFHEVWVMGEISQMSDQRSGSGHMYFSIRDEHALLKCAMFRQANRKLLFEPKVGAKVEARGRITVYEEGGQYQLVCDELSPLGVGILQLRLEELKKKLAKEGLFDEARKRPLPPFPERIGIVTSSSGAAIRDIERILGERWPGIEMILAPVRVQGEGAADEIARAIDNFNRFGEVDVLIVGRGGGPPEDLWAFNEEVVARSIFSSHIPVISAVGHEIDFTIADFVADMRAPTPSAAAKMAVKDKLEVLEHISDLESRLKKDLLSLISNLKIRLERLRKSYGLMRPVDILEQRARRVDELSHSLRLMAGHFLDEKKKRTESLVHRLTALSPREVLRRGYCVVRGYPAREIVKRVKAITSGQKLELEFLDGLANCSVLQTSQSQEER
ncbi:MAG: exodeoxyribonuclease VII large subunit [Candidatus Eisenbacteria bacterium]|nr:exodeoxyribonuclease VII large subunit [Candidatus Eisenbacteria bacterium]